MGLAGGSGASATEERHYYFADAKAPFTPNDVMVSPQGMVWVARTQPFGAGGTTYDVFNGEGARVDRVLLSGYARVVGFGSGRGVCAVAQRRSSVTRQVQALSRRRMR